MPGTGRCPASGRRGVPSPSYDGVSIGGLGMRAFLEAVTGFPTFLFTVPLVTAAGFWLLVAVGVARPQTFDKDIGLRSRGLGGVPVAVALSLWTVIAWAGSLGAVALMEPPIPTPTSRAVIGLIVLLGVPNLSWCVARAAVRLLIRAGRADDGPLQGDRSAEEHQMRRRGA